MGRALAPGQARADRRHRGLQRLGRAVDAAPGLAAPRVRRVLGEGGLVEAVGVAAAAPEPGGAGVAAEGRLGVPGAHRGLEVGARGVAPPGLAAPAGHVAPRAAHVPPVAVARVDAEVPGGRDEPALRLRRPVPPNLVRHGLLGPAERPGYRRESVAPVEPGLYLLPVLVGDRSPLGCHAGPRPVPIVGRAHAPASADAARGTNLRLRGQPRSQSRTELLCNEMGIKGFILMSVISRHQLPAETPSMSPPLMRASSTSRTRSISSSRE